MTHDYLAGIIGLGNIAWRLDHGRRAGRPALTHASAYTNDERVKLVGGCSPQAMDRDGFSGAFNIPVFPSAELLLEATRPDLVSICSPPEFHSQHVLLCIEHNIPMVWLEKPPTRSVEETNRLLDEIDKHSAHTRVLVNYQRRYVDEYKRLRGTYRNRMLGECRGIHVSYSKGLERNGSHILDALFYVLGDESECSVEWVSPTGGDNPSFVIRFPSGLTAFVSGMDLPYHCIDISLTYESGRVSVLHGGMTFVMEEKSEHELFPGYHRLKENSAAGPTRCDIEHGLQRALRDLMESFEQKRDPVSSLRTARNAQLLIEQVERKRANPTT